jgi:dolichol-phosphate mannosyltransferase
LPLLAALWAAHGPCWAISLNTALACARLGVLGGAARAYRRRPLSYWLSPLADLPAALTLISSALRRRHVWRGRVLVRGGLA